MKFSEVSFTLVLAVLLTVACNVSSQETTTVEQPCVVPILLAPVCGSDGKTYDNEYALACETLKNPNLKFVRGGRCDASPRP